MVAVNGCQVVGEVAPFDNPAGERQMAAVSGRRVVGEVARGRAGVPRGSFVVAIDGPAASGKTVLGRALARRFGFAFLDTGLLYRALTAVALERGVPVTDGEALARLAESLRFEVRASPGSSHPDTLYVDGREVGAALRTRAVDANVSTVSAHPAVRAALLRHQCALAERADTVMVGRDIGTVVLPDAELKLYLVASPEVRARRRWRDVLAAGGSASFPEILGELVRRDARDGGREVAPMRPAADAVIVHTDRLGLPEEIELAARLVEAARRLR